MVNEMAIVAAALLSGMDLLCPCAAVRAAAGGAGAACRAG